MKVKQKCGRKEIGSGGRWKRFLWNVRIGLDPMWQLFYPFLDYKDKDTCAFDTKCECTQCKWGLGNPQGRVNVAVIGWFTFTFHKGEWMQQLLVHFHFQWNFQSTCCARKSSRAEVIQQVMSTGGNGATLGLTCFSLGACCTTRLHQTQTNFHLNCVTVIII